MSSAYGALKTLMLMLQEAPSLAGIDASVVFGEENIIAQEWPLPLLVIVPRDGGWGPPGAPGYYRNANVDLYNIWMTQENVDIYLWNSSTDPDAQPVDHADAVEDIRARVLQALQYQAPNGLMFRPISGRWAMAQNEVNRYGRGYVLTVQVDISVPDVLPVDVAVSQVTIIKTLTTGS